MEDPGTRSYDSLEGKPRESEGACQWIGRPQSVLLTLCIATLAGAGIALCVGLGPGVTSNPTHAALPWALQVSLGEQGAPAFSSFAGVPGTGVDLSAGSGRLPFVSTPGEVRPCHLDGQSYMDVPESVECNPMRGKLFPSRRVYLFDTFKEYESQVNEWRARKSGVGGFFVWTSQTREVYRNIFEDQEHMVAVVHQEHPFVELSLNIPSSERSLTRRAQMAVEYLTSHQSESTDRQEFIRQFGTHYVASVEMGGIVELQVYLKRSLFKAMSKEDIMAQAANHFEQVLKIDHTHILAPEYTKARTGKAVMFWGGKPDLDVNERTLEGWLATVPSNPAAISFHAEEFSRTAPSIESSKALSYSVNEFFDDWALCRSRGCLAHGVCTAGGHCHCDPQYTGPSCRIIPRTRGEFTEVAALPAPRDRIVANDLCDINGDGLKDYVRVSLHFSGRPKIFKVEAAVSQGDYKFVQTDMEVIWPEGFITPDAGWTYTFMDVNNDGFGDILCRNSDHFYTLINEGGGAFTPYQQQWTFKGRTRLAAGDPPVIFQRLWDQTDAPLEVSEWSNHDQKWIATEYPLKTEISFKKADRLFIGGADIDGDGNHDLVYFTENAIYTQFSTGKIGNFSQEAILMPTPRNILFSFDAINPHRGDVNGDGKTDFIHIGQWGQETNFKAPSITTFISRGDGLFLTTSHTPVPPLFNEICVRTHDYVRVGDFDNDGKSDVYMMGPKNKIAIAYSIGTGEYEWYWIEAKMYAGLDLGNLVDRVFVGKLNGKSNADGLLLYSVRNSDMGDLKEVPVALL